LNFTNIAVELKNLHVRYPVPTGQGSLDILKGISLSIPKGNIFGIIGRSGAGKSTLLRCLNGLVTPTSGDITINQEPFTKNKSKERRKTLQQIGTVFQHFNLLSRRTVLENIALPLECIGYSPHEIITKATQVAELVGLTDKLHAFPSQLSGGQKQRVAIARALVSDVTLLLCDEFTSALDPETSLDILALLRDLNKRLGITIVLISHDMSVVREICDQVCVLDNGQIVETGSVEEILLRPQHEITQSLVRHLFVKDLPRTISDTLHPDPRPNDHAVLRLFFSHTASYQPAIADIIQKFHVPINILIGSLGHVREVAFGSLVVTLPAHYKSHNDTIVRDILTYFNEHQISAEILGFIPSP
jgi:D-methionine transport system ATP-binding protein